MAQSSADEECGICLDALTNPVALPCCHKFCSTCLDSWRSKYGPRGDPEKMGRGCPLCREKIPPSKEMVMQLKCLRKTKNKMEADGGTLTSHYVSILRAIERLEQEVGDWTETIDNTEESECEVLPESISAAAVNSDFQRVFDWLGLPPVDKKRIDARNPELMDSTLLHSAVMNPKSDFLGILLQFGADVNATDAGGATPLVIGISTKCYEQARLLLEWGAETDHQYFGVATKEEMVSYVHNKGNMKLASLLMSELGGRRCELVNYSTRPELNGKTCVVEKHLPDKDRYKIAFEGSGQKALVPPHNLKRRDRTPTDCGYYITFKNGGFSRRDFASKEECQAYVEELESKHATDQLARLDISSSATAKG